MNREPVAAGEAAGNRGVAQPRPGLPKGGGAIRGIGEKFAANLVTGSASATLPIAATPGRSGFGPALALTYDSGAGNGPFGFGWSLALPAITRKTDRGIPLYDQGAEPDVFILSGAEDLVPVLVDVDGDLLPHHESRTAFGQSYTVRRYRPRVEGLFARIEHWSNDADASDTCWRSISRDNVNTWYGRTAESRIFDPGNPRRVFGWLICETHDDKGQVASYGYLAEDSAGVDPAALHERQRTPSSRTAARYLKRVRYGNRAPYFPDLLDAPRSALPTDWCFELVFDYGEHDAVEPLPVQDSHLWGVREDPFSNYRAGFEVRQYRLCRRILMFHHFAGETEVGADCLVRSTDFSYSSATDPADPRSAIHTFLLSATQAGYRRRSGGGYTRRDMPAVEFEYSQAIIDPQLREVDPASLTNLPQGVDAAYQWLDLDGEGISGILVEERGAWYYKRNESPVGGAPPATRFGVLQLLRSHPAVAALAGATQWLDLAGDGRLAAVAFSGPTPGFQRRTPEGSWSEHRTFASLPAIDWTDRNLRFLDLTGDGHADVLIAGDGVFTWHAAQGEAGFGPAQRVHQPLDEETGARIVFADDSESILLADLSGDGLTDIVRIRNGDICYWPNLGHGRFGARVGMDHAPWFEAPDVFDPRRIRLADIDGSGTTDILYFAGNGVRIYFNQSGNRWSAASELAQFPAADGVSSAAVVDLLGTGTACIVWSSSLPGCAARPLRYIDLMAGGKPHLLVGVRNNLGAETRVRYAPSTRFYVEDRDAGTPWITRLPFPVHVVERVERLDRISGNRFVTRYRYRHGYFDTAEREFRGFGRVDQWDTEELAAVPVASPSTNIDAASYVPPVRTCRWFHTGAYLDGPGISRQFADEYWRAVGSDDEQAQALQLPDTVIPPGLVLEEAREACRALRGSLLREEVYADDGTPLAALPYAIREQNFSLWRVQVQGSNRHAVFFVHARESIAHQIERNPSDPRTTHQLTLAVDAFGNVLRSASIAYGRRVADAGLLPQDSDRQTRLLATCSENEFTNGVDDADAYLASLPSQSRTFEVTGLSLAAQQPRLTLRQVDQAITLAETIAHEATPDGSLQRRLIEQSRTRYRRNDLTDALPLGQVESLALPHDSRRLAFTSALLAHLYGNRVTEAMLIEGGYVPGEDDAGWWVPSRRSLLSPDADDTPAQELAFARRHFFQPRRFQDPFGNVVTLGYDAHDLQPIETRDALGNTVRASVDYRVLQPRQLTDANGNRTEAAFDTLGLLVGTAAMGKVDESVGDTLAGFTAELGADVVAAHLAAPLANPQALLQSASTRLVYDLFAYQRTQADAQPQPAVVCTLARETHVSDLAAGAQTRVQQSFVYSDGFGREIQTKIPAEPDADARPRWVGSGWTVANNKGQPVRRFEPFFSSTHVCEFDLRNGVSPVLLYDPLGRVVATLHPNHTWEKVAFDAWRQATWDSSDTVLLADPATDTDVGTYIRRLPTADYLPTWHAQRIAGDHGTREQAAAQKTAVHAATPALAHFDALGRPFLSVAHNRVERQGATLDEHHATRVELDIEGEQRAVRDAIVQTGDSLGRVVMRYDRDLLGRVAHSASMEAGERWILTDVAGQALRAWDSRGHALRSEYDALRRPLRHFVRGHAGQPAGVELLYGRSEYGEGEDDALARNLRTRVLRVFDGAGVVTSVAHDFKGNLLQSHRQLTVEYRSHPDWAAAPVLDPQQYTTTTTYDALNRPLSVTTPDASVTRHEYNEGGLLERLTANLQGADAATVFMANIGRNARGQRTRIDYGNGVRTTYAYDSRTFRLARLLTRRGADVLQDLTYVYDPGGNITDLRDDAQQTIWFNNAVVDAHADYTYDALYRLIEATGREHIGQLAAPQSTWNDAGRVGLAHPHDGQAMRRYRERYEYDGVGNFERMVHQAVSGHWTRRYDYEEASLIEPGKQSNRLSRTRVGATNEFYTHDVHGNMTSMPHLALMHWDFLDRLQASARQVVDHGTPETTWYVYDAAGQRLRKVTERAGTDGEASTRFDERVYLGAFDIYRRFLADGATVALARECLQLLDGGQRIALCETRTQGNDSSPVQRLRYQLGNHLGSSMLELDAAAAIVSYEEYHPYGGTACQLVDADARHSAKRFRNGGKERDEESGMSHHGARYFAPWLGRWTAADPIGLRDGVNRYLFVGANPANLVDVDGMMAEHPEGEGNRFAGYRHIPAIDEPAPARIPSGPRRSDRVSRTAAESAVRTRGAAAPAARRHGPRTAWQRQPAAPPVDGEGYDPGPVSAEARKVEDALRHPRGPERAPKAPLEGMFRYFEAARRVEIARAAKKTLSVLREQVYLPWRDRLGHIEMAAARLLRMAAGRVQMAKATLNDHMDRMRALARETPQQRLRREQIEDAMEGLKRSRQRREAGSSPSREHDSGGSLPKFQPWHTPGPEDHPQFVR